jgi:Uma2 family endonuclease
MKAFMPVALPEVLELRKRTGADRFDEMWEGVLHMPPAPDLRHQLMARDIVAFFAEAWEPRTGGLAVAQVNVSTPDRWPTDYRIPDVAIMTEAAAKAAETRFVQPIVAIEIRSPADETYEKLDFYAEVGVRALVVVERQTKAVQVFSVADGTLVLAAAGPGGWTLVPPLGVEVRTEAGPDRAALLLRMKGEPDTERAV